MDHGIALMSYREGFGFETDLQSDVAPVWGMVEAVIKCWWSGCYERSY